jgi:thioredoxin-like negative regulator of GroEL
MRARAAAIQGKEKDCRRALEAAYESLGNFGGSSPARWIAQFDEASLGSESALCFYALGALKEAENEARKVIELRRMSDRVRSRAFGQLTLANVLLKAGAVEEAAAVGAEICTVAHSLNSARVRSALAQLGQSLDTGPAVPEVEFFLDRLAELTEASVISHHQERWPL